MYDAALVGERAVGTYKDVFYRAVSTCETLKIVYGVKKG